MFVTNSLTGGGAERSMNLVCNELLHRGWPIALVPINRSEPDQIIPDCLVFPLHRQWHGSLKSSIRAIWRFHKAVHEWNPDIIILNCDLPEMFGATLLSKRKLVAVEHSPIPWIKRVPLGKLVRRILTFRRVTWASVSSHIDIWPQRGAPHAVLQNPLTPNFDSPNQERPKKTIGKKIERLIFIGRFSPEKRPDWALEISAKTGIELEFIGDGSMQPSIETQAVKRSINAHFRGQVNNPWLEIRAGDLLIVPSALEGDGLVVIEGLQKGIPMLLMDIPDFRRFGFPDKNYCTDLSGFVSRIEDFSNNLEDLKVSVETARAILDERNLILVGDSWEDFIGNLI